jgi:lipopolysaccharide export system protein LptC
LIILPNQDLVKTNSPVVITQAPNTLITGTGMIYDKKNRTVKLMSRVKVHYEKPNSMALKAQKPITKPASQLLSAVSPSTKVNSAGNAAAKPNTAKASTKKSEKKRQSIRIKSRSKNG